MSVVYLFSTQDDEEDFEHLSDEDEFEGFDKERTPKKSHEQPPDLKITKVCCFVLFLLSAVSTIHTHTRLSTEVILYFCILYFIIIDSC